MYSIRATPLSGLGVFATAPIARGTRIFSESPLLAIPSTTTSASLYSSSLLLSSSDRGKLLGLSSHSTPSLTFLRWNQALGYTIRSLFAGPKLRPGWWNVKQHVQTLSIFRSNSFNIPSASMALALFPTIARLNHSCLPNAQGNYHPLLKKFNIHATRDIASDEEVTVNYLPENGALREGRRERLQQGYGFQCLCPACVSKEGEQRRAQVRETLRGFVEEGGAEKDLKKELKIVEAFISLFEMDGIAGRELASLYLEAAKLNQGLENYEEALKCAERGVKLDGDCLGVDHPQYLEDLGVVKSFNNLTV